MNKTYFYFAFVLFFLPIALEVGATLNLAAKKLLPDNPVQVLEKNVFSDDKDERAGQSSPESEIYLDPTDFTAAQTISDKTSSNPIIIETYEGWK